MHDDPYKVAPKLGWRVGCGGLVVLLAAAVGYFMWVTWYASHQRRNRVEDAQAKLTRLTEDIIRICDAGASATADMTFLSEAGVDLGYLDANRSYSYTSLEIVIWHIETDESGKVQRIVLLARGLLHSQSYPFIWSEWSRSGHLSFRIETRSTHPERPDRPLGIEWDNSGRMVR